MALWDMPFNVGLRRDNTAFDIREMYYGVKNFLGADVSVESVKILLQEENGQLKWMEGNNMEIKPGQSQCTISNIAFQS